MALLDAISAGPAWPAEVGGHGAVAPAEAAGPVPGWPRLGPALAALGPLLLVGPSRSALPFRRGAPWPGTPCMAAPLAASELRVWLQVDREGPAECLLFRDARGQLLAALGLLPDSDFLQWGRLLEWLPASAVDADPRPAASRRGEGWRARPARLHWERDDEAGCLRASACSALSAPGRRVAASLAARFELPPP
jgi:hypothetical protein